MSKAAGACKPFRVTHVAERGLPKKPLAPLDRDVLDEGVEGLLCRNAGGTIESSNTFQVAVMAASPAWRGRAPARAFGVGPAAQIVRLR